MATATAYRLVAKALFPLPERASRMDSELTQTPTEQAPSKKRSAAIARNECVKGNRATAAAYPASEIASMYLAENRRTSGPMGSEKATIPAANQAASCPMASLPTP